MHRQCPFCPPEPAEGDRTQAARINPVTTALRHLDTLTDRESEVLWAMPGGESNTDLAEHLGITERTVKFHVTNMREKLGGLSRAQLHLLALLAEVVWPCRHCRHDGPGRSAELRARVPRPPMSWQFAGGVKRCA
ncbi:helix-turn-helix transcriptional regulator [Streptomyces globisporus]|uniref:helix-turn-helix domain-containing protein n=1 Tax=Streptomyces globisporus TaxID=1908 RepID=UPI00099D15F3|nr:helix-turn-helix transcriptional regulator [Streptomyces globisporus]